MIDFIKIPEKRKILLRKTNVIREIEEKTNIKLKMDDGIEMEGEGFNVYQAKNVLTAFGRGFDIKEALMLMEDEYGLEVIDLTEFIRSRNRLEIIKGRIIGTNGKTKKYIEKYTNVKLSILGKTVSILGKWDDLPTAREAVMLLVKGAMHSTLYRWLEKGAKVSKWQMM